MHRAYILSTCFNHKSHCIDWNDVVWRSDPNWEMCGEFVKDRSVQNGTSCIRLHHLRFIYRKSSNISMLSSFVIILQTGYKRLHQSDRRIIWHSMLSSFVIILQTCYKRYSKLVTKDSINRTDASYDIACYHLLQSSCKLVTKDIAWVGLITSHVATIFCIILQTGYKR